MGVSLISEVVRLGSDLAEPEILFQTQVFYFYDRFGKTTGHRQGNVSGSKPGCSYRNFFQIPSCF